MCIAIRHDQFNIRFAISSIKLSKFQIWATSFGCRLINQSMQIRQVKTTLGVGRTINPCICIPFGREFLLIVYYHEILPVQIPILANQGISLSIFYFKKNYHRGIIKYPSIIIFIIA